MKIGGNWLVEGGNKELRFDFCVRKAAKIGRKNWPQDLAAVWTCKRILKWNESDMWDSEGAGGGKKRKLGRGELRKDEESKEEKRKYGGRKLDRKEMRSREKEGIEEKREKEQKRKKIRVQKRQATKRRKAGKTKKKEKERR